MKTVQYTRTARKQLRRFPAQVRTRVLDKMAQYAVDPCSLANNVVALAGTEGGYRLRVGEYRVLFTEDLRVVEVYHVAPRGGAYR